MFFIYYCQNGTFTKKQIDKLIYQLKFDKINNGKEYAGEKICDNAIYIKKLGSYLLNSIT